MVCSVTWCAVWHSIQRSTVCSVAWCAVWHGVQCGMVCSVAWLQCGAVFSVARCAVWLSEQLLCLHSNTHHWNDYFPTEIWLKEQECKKDACFDLFCAEVYHHQEECILRGLSQCVPFVLSSCFLTCRSAIPVSECPTDLSRRRSKQTACIQIG